MMSALPSAAAHLGYEQPRLGSGIPYSVPRGTYRCADDRWVAISTSAESVAHRVLTLLGLGDDDRVSRRSRAAASIATSSTRRWRRGSARGRRPRCWPRSRRPRPRSRPCTRCARCWPIRTCRRGTCSSRSTASCMQGPVARLSRTPAEMRWAGRALGADTDEVLRELDETRDPTAPTRPARRAPPPAHTPPRASSQRIVRTIPRDGVCGVGGARGSVTVRGVVGAADRLRPTTAAAPAHALPPNRSIALGSTHAGRPLSDSLPHAAARSRRAFAAFNAECAALLDRATELDAAQQALAVRARRRPHPARGAPRRHVAPRRPQGHRARLPPHPPRRPAAHSARRHATRSRSGAGTCAPPRSRSSPATRDR